MEKNANTHDIFIANLSYKKLNELLLRAQKKVLENDINKRLKGITPVVASTNVTKPLKTPLSCSIYINFLNTQDDQIGHISFHFLPKRSNTIGRIHPKNNKNTKRRYTFRFNENGDTINMTLSKHCSILSSELQKCFDISMNVINPNYDHFLGKRIFPKEKHPCTDYIVKKMESSSTPIRSTRKRSHKTIN